MALLADGRFTLGLGSGEALNEHVVGRGWPTADVRQDMLDEAVPGYLTAGWGDDDPGRAGVGGQWA